MKEPEQASDDERPLSRDVRYALRYYLGGRTGLIALGAIVVVAGVALNWSWLVALGVAPLLIALAPCAIMCALGLCAISMANRSGTSSESALDIVASVTPLSRDEPKRAVKRPPLRVRRKRKTRSRSIDTSVMQVMAHDHHPVPERLAPEEP